MKNKESFCKKEDSPIYLHKSKIVTATLLHRINRAKNEARFYLVIAGSSLLDPHAVLRVWGRIGGHQRSMVTPCRTAAEAQAFAGALIRRRLRRGYVIVPGEESKAEAALVKTEAVNPNDGAEIRSKEVQMTALEE